MKIYVQANISETIELEVVPSDSIARIKADLQEKKGIPEEKQHLFFAGKRLEDEKQLSAYGIQNESTLILKVGQIMKIYVET